MPKYGKLKLQTHLAGKYNFVFANLLKNEAKLLCSKVGKFCFPVFSLIEKIMNGNPQRVRFAIMSLFLFTGGFEAINKTKEIFKMF